MLSTIVIKRRDNTPRSSRFTVASVCMNAKLDKETNLDTIKSYMRKASVKGAKLVVFPEISLQQNPGWGRSNHKPTREELAYLTETAETVPGPSVIELVEAARLYDIYVVFGMTENGLDGNLYNTSVFLGPSGIMGKYRKRHLWDSENGGNEHLSWEKGVGSGVFESPLGKVGLMICIEMSFGFGVKLVEEGADFIVTISAWPRSASESFEKVSKSNAVETGCWHIVSNQVGVVGHSVDYGHSRIVSPNGEVIVDTGEMEGMVTTTIEY
jgi:predicted amidohydrolase